MTALLPGEARPQDSTRRASWLVGLALALVTETGGDGADDPGAVRDLHTAAGGNVRDLEGAYGRALALRSEYPNDPQVTATIELLARALSQAQRGVGA